MGEPSADRLGSLADPAARPTGKGTVGKPNQFGDVAQLAEVTANTRREVLPAASAPGNPGEHRLLGQTVAEGTASAFDPARSPSTAGLRPADHPTLAGLAPTRIFSSGRAEPGSHRTRRRLARYRTGWEGRISHRKRG